MEDDSQLSGVGREDGGGGGDKVPHFDPMEALADATSRAGAGACSSGNGVGVNPGIEASSTFSFQGPHDMDRYFTGEAGPDQEVYLYSRHYNPTVMHLGRQLAALEGTEAAYCTSSGMAAISSALLQLLHGGDHVVASNRLYGGTMAFLSEFAPRYMVQVSFVDILDLGKVAEACVAGRTKVVYFESLSNPTLTVADTPKLADIAHQVGAVAVVDNTFAPLVLTPARHGADVVLHSLTKFVNGTSDIVAGAVCGSSAFIKQLMDFHSGALMLLGGTMNPQVAWQISMRLPHLGIRMKEHSARALLFATRLHKLGLKVLYPGLVHHQGHGLMQRLANEMYGFGGMLVLDMETLERARLLAEHATQQQDNAKGCFGRYAVSLGFHDSLMCISSSSTAHGLSDDEKVASGISPGIIRVSIGFTGSLEQRWSQMHAALAASGAIPFVQGGGGEWRSD
eukprot:jgi/Mesen1/4306/ME000022S03597